MGTGPLNARRLQLIVLSAIGVIVLIGIILLSTGSGDESLSLTRLQRGDPSDAVVTGTATGTRQIELVEEEENGRPLDSVEAFTQEHGEPPNSDFARLRIPSIGVNAPVGLFIVDGGMMPEPQGPVDVAFYDMRHWSGMGGYPGAGGNAIFGAHVDLNRSVGYAGGAHYRGPAVFWNLERLGAGDIIEVDYNGQTLRYAVAWMETLSAGGTDWYPIWTDNVEVDSITLFTCGGDFSAGEYTHRVIVRAHRI